MRFVYSSEKLPVISDTFYDIVLPITCKTSAIVFVDTSVACYNKDVPGLLFIELHCNSIILLVRKAQSVLS